ncbi:MAG: helix-turn-helix transcriptional regulator [Hyphomicrobiaceae bacterium]|nr:helix-turn-helix transcriptional regulator [Hyphomicrobiaceae bacterium]
MAKTKSLVSGGRERSSCPIASTLDIVGDKWSLILIRDLLTGKHRYNQFCDSPEGVPTNLLAARLRKLEQQGIITKEPYQSRPVRYAYSLTPAGRALLPVLQEICRWANAYIEDTWKPPETFMAMKPKT